MTNRDGWEHRMWIPLPIGYRSKGGKCDSCGRGVRAGEKVAKVTMDAPL